jgi:23S rRNA pseudouridine1911/1915/1917 synthase
VSALDSNIQILTFTVERNYAGWRIDKYLSQKIRRASMERIHEIIERDVSPVNQQENETKLMPSTLIWPGQTFEIRRRMREEPSVPGVEALKEIYIDDDILVVDKPAGLPIHPTARYANNTLTAQLKTKYAAQFGESFQAAPAHRLDRETSGLVICGRTLEASQKMMRLFHDGHVKKEYVALVEGHPPDDIFEINAPIAPGTELVRIAVRIDTVVGKEAITEFKVEKRFERKTEPFSLLRCFPKTGRQHQIRIHLKTAGFPIVGDKMYGPDPMFFDAFSKGTLEESAWQQLRLKRHALHAAVLHIEHPRTKVMQRFEAPIPDDMTEFMESL